MSNTKSNKKTKSNKTKKIPDSTIKLVDFCYNHDYLIKECKKFFYIPETFYEYGIIE